jgi:predicted 3-demethylubiquinone-9 3-methyltransferase (glyoxalase superfamily)
VIAILYKTTPSLLKYNTNALFENDVAMIKTKCEPKRGNMQRITTFLTFNNQAEEAINLYVSIFPNSRILSINRYGEGAPIPAGTVMSATFELDGQQFTALNGGPHFTFSDGISLFVSCQTQEEVDDLWEKLSAGGSPGPCGWLKDKFGVSWQIIPTVLGELLGDPDPAKAQRVMQAMLQMSKLDIATLRQA